MRQPSQEVSVIPARGPDASIIAALQNTLLPDEPWRARDIARLLESPQALGFLAVGRAYGETMPLGFVLGRLVLDEGEVLSIGVLEGARRQGVARRLLEAVLARARAAGARRLTLDVGTDNLPALRLYEALGFEQVGRRRDYYRRGDGERIDGLILGLNLS